MGSGTDVAIDTADLVVTDDNFISIVEGIKEGRIAYSNIRKIVLFLLSCGISEVLFYLFSVCLDYELPLIAIQLLLINIVTDGLQDVALSFEKGTKDIMLEKPRNTNEAIFSKDLMIEVLIFGLTISFMIFMAWKYLIDNNTNFLIARSIIMLIMVFVQNLHVLNCRSEKNSIFKTSILSNKLIITILVSIFLQLFIINIPVLSKFLKIANLSFNTIIASFIFSLLIIVVSEIYKFIYKKLRDN